MLTKTAAAGLIACIGLCFMAIHRQSARELTYHYMLQNDDVQQDEHEFQDYRFLAFGTSKTWGSGLFNRSYAYPWLLSPNATNLAIRAAGPQVPSMCTYSMVGDGIYDVIILEFYFHANDYMINLVKRLKHRFPKATFIFLKIWSPFQFHLKSDRKKCFMDLLKEEVSKQDYTIQNFYNVLGRSKNEDWFYVTSQEAEVALNKVVELTDGHIITQQLDPTRIKEYLATFGEIFLYDGIHFSEYGHRWMRNAILSVLREYKVQKHDEVNPWNEKDSCVTWFESGNLTGVEYDPALTLNQFTEDKYALEMDGIKSTWIKVNNPMDKEAKLFLNHMARGGSSEKSYPLMSVKLEGQEKGKFFEPVEISRYPFPVHLVHDTFVGMVPPGNSTIQLDVVHDNVEPFRMVGVIITPEVKEENK